MSIDKYGEQASFTIAGSKTYPSFMGTLITILVISVVIPFGFNKFLIMRDREDTKFHTTEESLGSEEVLSYEQTHANVMLSFQGFIDDDLKPISMEDLEGYIDILALLQTFDRRNGEYTESVELLGLSPCSKQYVDINFFSHESFNDKSFDDNIEFSICIDDPQRIEHVGNTEQIYYKGLVIVILRCQGQYTECKSEEEIDAFLENKFLYVYHNDEKFSPDEYDKRPVISKLKEEIFSLT